MNFFFVTDLHGDTDQYKKLFDLIQEQKPEAVFFGGDLMESGLKTLVQDISFQKSFICDFLIVEFKNLKNKLKNLYPEVFIILGNDDVQTDEEDLIIGQNMKLWHYINQKNIHFNGFDVYGYSFIPPTPFFLKDFEKYDVSQYIDPGCVAPEDGHFSFEVNKALIKRDTIKRDLDEIALNLIPERSIFLFHSPPYNTKLDRADLDGKFYNHVPLDVHVGSIAIRRFIEQHQPKITLHGHIHESTRLTGEWKEKLGQTTAMSAAHDGDELCLVVFDPNEPENAIRKLI